MHSSCCKPAIQAMQAFAILHKPTDSFVLEAIVCKSINLDKLLFYCEIFAYWNKKDNRSFPTSIECHEDYFC